MDSILQSLPGDPHIGLQTDATGRRFFRQRRVRFTTIEFSAADLLVGGWDRFTEPLEPPPRSGKDPDPAELRRYAADASQRFLALWYRYIDVLVARSIFGRDRRIFLLPFCNGNMFMDTGVAEDPVLSAVADDLHEQIVRDYREGNRATPYRIFTLSSYLEGLTDDLREALSPLHAFWQKEEERERILAQIDTLTGDIEKRLQTEPMRRLDASLNERCRSLLQSLSPFIKQIESALLRQALQGDVPMTNTLRREILSYAGETELVDLVDLFELPARLGRLLRRVSFYETRRLHETLRLLRLRSRLTDRLQAMKQRLLSAREELDVYVHNIETKRLLPRLDTFNGSEDESARILRKLYTIPEQLATLHDDWIALYRHWLTEASSPDFVPDRRYPPASLPEKWNPVRDETAVLASAREILVERLRPVRQTASDYSLRPEHRHGILTLNPVLRLWKERTALPADLPALCRRQINTADVLALLLDLVQLVDVDLASREVAGGRILREKHGRRDLSSMRFFLIPGSCYPVREVAGEDFPEYRHRIIGDRRHPRELGVQVEEENGVLTGAWYRKATHSLYYPVGADNAALLQLIYTAGRSPSVPAFFFALGQFVHDCMPDSLIYYRSGQKTFREVVEDFYNFEERIRKNRDEKTGRRRKDNSRSAVRFLFAIQYSRYVTEALTASSQGAFRHPATEEWFARHTRIPLLSRAARSTIRSLRERARRLIEARSAQSTQQEPSR